LIGAVSADPWLVLLALAVLTVVFTELVTNNAAAVLMFPIAVSAADALGLESARPYVMAIALCASASFLTPIGYQTNLMVYGPGGYRFTDYPRTGLPLTLLTIAVAVGLSPLIWPWGG
ncbi:MAG: SLC13 family permease, partial [Planctomycetota bacterium]